MALRDCTALAAAMLLLVAGPAPAEIALEAVDGCIAVRADAGQQPLSCVEDAQAECASMQADAPDASALCYVEAERAWAAGIGILTADIADRAAPDATAVAQVNAKYDILFGLLQCDRLEELAVVASELDEKSIAVQKKRCQTTASGLAYVRLKLLGRSLP